MKFSLFIFILSIATTSFATPVSQKRVEVNSDKIDNKLVKIETRLKEISQKLSLTAQAPKRNEGAQDTRQTKLDTFKENLIHFTEGLTQRQLFIRYEINRNFQKFLSSAKPWNEITGLSRSISFYAKAIPGLNVSDESKKYAETEIQKLSAEAKKLVSLAGEEDITTEAKNNTADSNVLLEAGNDLLYLQNDIQGVREEVAQLAVSKIQAERTVITPAKIEEASSLSKYFSLGFFFIGSVVFGFVMRGKTSKSPKAKQRPVEPSVARSEMNLPELTVQSGTTSYNLPPIPVDMDLSSNEMEEYLNYLEIPIFVINEEKAILWSNRGSVKASLSYTKYETLSAEGLIDSMGYPVVIHNGVLYRTNISSVKASCWNGENVELVQLVPHEYSQIEFSTIKNKSKFITDFKAVTKEKNNINTVLIETVDRFKYLFSQSNITFDYLPLDEDAFITMKRDDLDSYCRDVIYMLNRLVLDSHAKHELILEAKLSDERVHFKFYLMNFNYQLSPEQQERLNGEFTRLHTIENSLSAYQGRLSLRTLKGEISSLEIDLSLNLYPVGTTYSNSHKSEASV